MVYAVYPYSLGKGDVAKNIELALEDYRQRFDLDPKSIVVNTVLLKTAREFVTNQGLTIDVEGRWGCLSWEVWLEV